jgi:LysM repeat protein
MKNKYLFIFILIITLALGLAACTRSASQPPESGDESGSSIEAVGTADPMKVLEGQATQTAVAKQELEDAVEPESGEDATSTEGETEETSAEDAATEGETDTEGSQEDTMGGTSEEDDEEVGGGQEPVEEAKEYKVPDSYTLKSGEFPYCIARRFNIDPIELLSANGLSLNAQVYPGTTLTIPKNAGEFNLGPRSLRDHPTNYTVLAGDTIYSIACLFGDVDPRAIEDVNGLGAGETLSAGQVIKIP